MPTPIHLALRQEPYGAPCGEHYGTFSAWGSAVTCDACLAAIEATPEIVSNIGHSSALTTLSPPVVDDPSVPRNTHLLGTLRK
jgi:hypothetical protein